MHVQDYTESMFHASVGRYGASKKQCYNTTDDQEMLRDLLNAVPENQGGAGGKLAGPLRWGIVGEDVYRAVVRFQKAHPEEGLSVDGHVDPHEKTLRLLLRLSKASVPPPVPPAHGVMPEIGPLPGPDPATDPNTVFAGEHFKIKMLDGSTVGDIVGGFLYHFRIWDLDNNRSAEYTYKGGMMTFGPSPINHCGEGPWSDPPFTAPHAIQVDQFGGQAAHSALGAPPKSPLRLPGMPPLSAPPSGGFWLEFFGNPFLGAMKLKVSVPTAASWIPAPSAESGKAPLTLQSGSVKVFSGP